MAFGNYAPFYRPNYYPMQQMQEGMGQYGGQYQGGQAQMPMQAPSVSDMIVVLNENEATSYFVAPNNTVTLWDKNLPTVYVKSVDGNGVPSMRILDYVERVPSPPKTAQEHACGCGGKYVKVEDFDALRAKIDALESKLEEYKPRAAKSKKTEVEENE